MHTFATRFQTAPALIIQMVDIVSPDQYVTQQGTRCPVCQGEDLEVTEWEYQDRVRVAMLCRSCTSTWWETFALTGYQYLTVGQGVGVLE